MAHRLAVAAVLVAASAAGPAVAQAPRLDTDQAYVEHVRATENLDVADPMAVLAFVLQSLPDRVKVYPTENYYYFGFFHAGTRYAGNIRLAAAERDSGKVHFEYYQARDEWSGEGFARTLVLDRASGVAVERLEPLLYRVSYGGRSVEFALNDLSRVKPPPAIVGPDESVLGPVFDESGIRFFLVFNARLKIFHFILDESEPVPDQFFPSGRTDRIVIGRRTGFAFYRDRLRDRKILIGAFEKNSRLNTYFDGPFDQLPENFIVGEELRAAILASDPATEGQIDRLGNFLDGSGRYLIHPYLLYRRESDLMVAHRCSERSGANDYYRCFVLDTSGRGGILGQPLPPQGERHRRRVRARPPR